MGKLTEWLRSQWWPGTLYSSPRQLSLAISEGKDQVAYADIERKGLVKFDRARALARATSTSVLRIVLFAGIIDETEIEAVAGRSLTASQEKAAGLIQSLPDDFADAWLESGERLLELAEGQE